MDQVLYHQELQSLNLFMKYKKALQFILTLSIFSILISQYSWFSSLFLHSMNLYFNNFSFHLVDCALDRKYLFLICNGILVFLSTNSGLIGSPSSKIHQNEMGEVKYVEVEVQYVVQEDQKYEEEIKNEISTKNKEVKEEEENWVMIANEEFEEEEEEKENEAMVKYDEGEEENGIFMDEQGGHGMLSTEELNKKFDEFIRKMKEEIRVGAQQQQQLVMV